MSEAFGQCLGLVSKIHTTHFDCSLLSLLPRSAYPVPADPQGSALTLDPYLAVHVVRVDLVEYPSRIELEPCSPDDWEVVELHAGYLEEELLGQVSNHHVMIMSYDSTLSRLFSQRV